MSEYRFPQYIKPLDLTICKGSGGVLKFVKEGEKTVVKNNHYPTAIYHYPTLYGNWDAYVMFKPTGEIIAKHIYYNKSLDGYFWNEDKKNKHQYLVSNSYEYNLAFDYSKNDGVKVIDNLTSIQRALELCD